MQQWAKSVVGQTLGRTYQVERLLGVGSVGAVYVARQVRTGVLCAVKVLHRRAVANEEHSHRFQEDARVIAALRHPNILPVTDFDRDGDGLPFLVMDLLEGENLQQRLRSKGSLPLPQVMELAQQVGSALTAAHRAGVLHRNLKPENIFLSRYDLGDRVIEMVKVADFGLARLRRGPHDRDGSSVTPSQPVSFAGPEPSEGPSGAIPVAIPEPIPVIVAPAEPPTRPERADRLDRADVSEKTGRSGRNGKAARKARLDRNGRPGKTGQYPAANGTAGRLAAPQAAPHQPSPHQPSPHQATSSPHQATSSPHQSSPHQSSPQPLPHHATLPPATVAHPAASSADTPTFSSLKTDPRSLLGFSQYLAPEVMREETDIDGRVDQWALSVILYRMLSGKLPFDGESAKDVLRQVLHEDPVPLSQLAPEVPIEVVDTIARGLSRRREDRFDTIMDFMHALQARPAPALSTLVSNAIGEVPRAPVPLVLRQPQATEPPAYSVRAFAAAAMLVILVAGYAVWSAGRHGEASADRAMTRPAPTLAVNPTVASPGPPYQAPQPVPSPALSSSGSLGAVQPSAAPSPAVQPPPAAARPFTPPAVAHAVPAQVPPLAANSHSSTSRHHTAEVRSGETPSPPPTRPSPAPPIRDARDERNEPAEQPEPVTVETANLQEAQEAYVNGDQRKAMTLALAVAEKGDPAAWRFVGSVACGSHNLRLASRAYRRLDSADRPLLLSLCQKQGMTYQGGEFRLDADDSANTASQ